MNESEGGNVIDISMSTTIFAVINLFLLVASAVVTVYIVWLLIKALKKYIGSKEMREEKAVVKQTLGETLKAHRVRCRMTQEFVAERLGVSRQAVSKWENGTSDPSTSNLIALAKLYEISVEELLKGVQ